MLTLLYMANTLQADWREDSKCWQVALHVAKLAKLTGSPALEVVVLMYFMSVRLVGGECCCQTRLLPKQC